MRTKFRRTKGVCHFFVFSLPKRSRVNNPDNYNPDGTIKKGRRKWKNSKEYIKTRLKLFELFRRQSAHRKSLHGKMINDILRHGNEIYIEKIKKGVF
ncbi:hypothetical protein DK28_0202035 [Peptococcaceae bacterium SCADC1_2_3]|nr:hypothetical protein DK28_0202035 [Peptococcaceae bacterium SCADC1_2_3]KFI35929.1 hypothetical protein HY00_10735 [Peptococcaceae bacterium SCADC1_2_3]